MLQKIRNLVASSRLGVFLRRTGLARLPQGLYERRSIRTGRHEIRHRGRTLAFAVRDRFDVRRVDDFLRCEAELYERIARQLDGVFFDIGANGGVCSVLAAADAPGADVHAFEPNPDTAARARDNAAINRLPNLTVHTIALGAVNGEARLGCAGGDSSADSLLKPGIRGILVPVERADDFARRNRIVPRIVKIDVEGSELDVLRGMGELLADCVTDVFLEIHDPILRGAGIDPEDVVRHLERYGFTTEWRQTCPIGPYTGSHQHFSRR